MIVKLFAWEGYFVQIVDDGAAVVGIAQKSHTSLILLDPKSPQEGINTCHLLRACEETLHVPILMMATDEEGDCSVSTTEARGE